MHAPLILPSLFLSCRTHTRISVFFFSCAEIHGHAKEVENEPLMAIENRKKKVCTKNFIRCNVHESDVIIINTT